MQESSCSVFVGSCYASTSALGRLGGRMGFSARRVGGFGGGRSICVVPGEVSRVLICGGAGAVLGPVGVGLGRGGVRRFVVSWCGGVSCDLWTWISGVIVF